MSSRTPRVLRQSFAAMTKRHRRSLYVAIAVMFIYHCHFIYSTEMWIAKFAVQCHYEEKSHNCIHHNVSSRGYQSFIHLFSLLNASRDFAVTTTKDSKVVDNNNNKENPPIRNNNEENPSNSHDESNEAVANEYASACLYIRDYDFEKNPSALVEWMAYHYQVLPLRYLIVAVPVGATNKKSANVQRYSWSNVFNRYRRLQDAGLINMTIHEWTDQDYMTNPIVHRIHVRPVQTKPLEREGNFYYRCLQAVHHRHRKNVYVQTQSNILSAWTWLAHVDEYFVRKNTNITTAPLQNNNSIGHQQHHALFHTVTSDIATKNSRSKIPRCLPLCHSRHRAINNVPKSSSSPPPQMQPPQSSLGIPANWSMSWFQTLHFQLPGHDKGYSTNASKPRPHNFCTHHHHLMDARRFSPTEILPPLLRIKGLCRYSADKNKIESDFQVIALSHDTDKKNHDRETTMTRPSESRNSSDISNNRSINNLARWLPAFIQNVGEDVAKELLFQDDKSAIGLVLPSGNHGSIKNNNDSGYEMHPTLTAPSTEQCALLFFGLPRAYSTLVLPSIVKNVLIPNARHGCDVFVHYYYATSEPSGRRNNGGPIDPSAILKLADAVRLVATTYNKNNNNNNNNSTAERQKRMPIVDFTYDTNSSFWYLRYSTVRRYRTAKDRRGNRLYFPSNAVSYDYPSTLDNIVKQWHSIETVWNLMGRAMRRGIANYTRVAMLRSDAMYVTPIDIYRTSFDDQEDDVKGKYVVLPPFGLYPVNDRMVYGPYRAVKIWATKRFQYIENHVRNHPWGTGFGMHSEMFLKLKVVAAIERDTDVNVTMNPDICFFRTRADESIMTSDCEVKGETRGIRNMSKQQVIIDICGFSNCTNTTTQPDFQTMKCE